MPAHIANPYTSVIWYRNESCRFWTRHTSYEWVVTSIYVSCLGVSRSRVSYIFLNKNESCLFRGRHTCHECVMSRLVAACLVWPSHVSFKRVMNDSCLCMTQSNPVWMSHVPSEWVMSRLNESCLVWMIHVFVWKSHVSYQHSSPCFQPAPYKHFRGGYEFSLSCPTWWLA